MLTVLWSVKGGVGVTTVSVVAAAGEAPGGGALLVDLGGDAPAATGGVEPDLGLSDWLASEADGDGLARIEVQLGRGLDLLPLGGGSTWGVERARFFVELLLADHREVVVDLGAPLGGAVDRPGPLGSLRELVLSEADRSVLVTRACYLALRRAARAHRPSDGVVLVREPGRALDRSDVEALLTTTVIAEVDLDPAVARAVDAGLLLARTPRHLVRSLRGLG